MSTFRGVVAEFPDIRIDYFRHSPDSKPALACFLSHIHSDHLQGLEGFYGGPFIYCSEATKELLIRLERRAHRINFAKKVVEAHDFTHADKKQKLKTIPLETPTTIELGNGRNIRVTLFDANHCPGAVMFLIEDEKNSILYTGDIRAEPWWVNAIVRHPVFVPYTMGIKCLSSIYLDTSFASRERLYDDFCPKAEGISELLRKIMKYPGDTVFHFNTWTFGYEDVWVALSAAFNTKIHVDKYQHRLFRSIREKGSSTQGPFLNGFSFGNSTVEGRLTTNPDCRFHSCDRRLDCVGLQGKKVVYIVPIVTRIGNAEIQETGIGQGDLESHSEIALHSENLKLFFNILGSAMTPKIFELLNHASNSRNQALPLEWGTEDKIAFSMLNEVLSRVVESKALVRQEGMDDSEIKKKWDAKVEDYILGDDGEWLPTRISFPYSRHSSYNELRYFVGKFRPLDIYPCVVDENNWSESRCIKALFGDICSGDRFAHDEEMRVRAQIQRGPVEWEAESNSNTSFHDHGSSQVMEENSQWRDSDSEDLNEQDWYRQLRNIRPPVQADTKRLISIKGALKREASQEDAIQDKKSKLEFGVTTEISIPLEKPLKEYTDTKRDYESPPALLGLIKQKPEIETRARSTQEDNSLLVQEEGKEEVKKLKEKFSVPVDETTMQVHSSSRLEEIHILEKEVPLTGIGGGKPPEDNRYKIYQTPTVIKPIETTLGLNTKDNAQPLCSTLDPYALGQGKGSYTDTPNRSDLSFYSTQDNSRLRFFDQLLSPLPLDDNFDLERLEQAVLSALGTDGSSWWNMDLECTRPGPRHEGDLEL